MYNLCSCKSIHSKHITRNMIINILPLKGWQHCRSAASTNSWTLYKWFVKKFPITFGHTIKQVQSHYWEPKQLLKNGTACVVRTLLQGTLRPLYRALSEPFYKALSVPFYSAISMPFYNALYGIAFLQFTSYKWIIILLQSTSYQCVLTLHFDFETYRNNMSLSFL